MAHIRTIFQLSWRHYLMFFEAVGLSIIASVAIRVLPFRWIAGWLGRQQTGDSETPTLPEDTALLQRVRWVVAAVARRVPWNCKCLVQAMMAKSMLSRRGVSGVVHFGLTSSDSTLGAHAWLEAGTTIVTGRIGLRKYATVSKFVFGDPERVGLPTKANLSSG